MIKFKQFLEEQTTAPAAPKNIEDLPLQQGHQGMGVAANMLQGLHDTFRGKKSPIKTAVDMTGPKITFGIHPKSKTFFISHNGIDTFNHEEAKYMYGEHPDKPDLEMSHVIETAHKNLPLIMPKNAKPGDMYNGTILYTKKSGVPDWLPKNTANMGISVDSTVDGKMLTNKHRSKFQVHPNVYNVNSEVATDPINYDPAMQHEYLYHMAGVNSAYRSMGEDDLDTAKPHAPYLKRYLADVLDNPDSKMAAKEYAQHLTAMGASKMHDAEHFDKAKINNRFSDLVNSVYQNEKAFNNVIKMLGHLHRATRVISKTAGLNKNPGNVTVYDGDNTGILRLRK